jgi:hypothetical protein
MTSNIDPAYADSFYSYNSYYIIDLAVIQFQIYSKFGKIKLVKNKKWVGSEKLFV